MFGITNWTGSAAPEIPELAADAWINSPPLTVKSLRGKVILFDFWEYSCINCVRTLPYLKSWYERYHNYGLEIIGAHTPEFEFGKDKKNVEGAMRKLGVVWPVVLDNDYKIWSAWENSVWPREFLIDQAGIVVHDHSGEGGYQETEETIQKLLRKNNPDAKFPALMELVRDIDNPGRVCFRTSPEVYAGYERGTIGNPEGHKRGEVVEYAEPTTELEEDVLYVAGKWKNNLQSLQRAAGNMANSPTDTVSHGAPTNWLGLKYHAKGVFAVVKPEEKPGFKVYIEQNSKPLDKKDVGEDIQFDGDGRSYFVVDAARMYRLVNNREFGAHVLKLFPTSDSFGLYTFTFETACQ